MERTSVKISTTELQRTVADVVNRVHYGQTQVHLTRHGKTVAVIISPADAELFAQLLKEREQAGIDAT